MVTYQVPLEYSKAHAVCPRCGAEKYSSVERPPKVEDGHLVESCDIITCLSCDWKGTGHDLVPAGSVEFIQVSREISVYSIYQILEKAQGQIAAQIRVMLGEAPLPTTAFSEASSPRRVKAMQDCVKNTTSDEVRHASWVKMHVEAGWVYGEVFDEKTKTHPNLKPWNELPAAVHGKAKIFAEMAAAAENIVQLLKGRRG